jgi:hypothetical protein
MFLSKDTLGRCVVYDAESKPWQAASATAEARKIGRSLLSLAPFPCRKEQDGTCHRNQHPHRVYFRKVVVAALAIATLAIATLVVLCVRRDRENQSGGYQREHFSNAIVRSRTEHPILIGIIWPEEKDRHGINLPPFVALMAI